MVATVAELVTLLSGVANGLAPPDDGYILYGRYNITTTTLTQMIEMSIRWGEKQIAEGVRTDATNVDTYDDMILFDAAHKVLLQHVMGFIMREAFSYTSLELSVDKKNFPDVVMSVAQSFLASRNQYLYFLKKGVEVISQTSYGVDPYNISKDNFVQTAPWSYD